MTHSKLDHKNAIIKFSVMLVANVGSVIMQKMYIRCFAMVTAFILKNETDYVDLLKKELDSIDFSEEFGKIDALIKAGREKIEKETGDSGNSELWGKFTQDEIENITRSVCKMIHERLNGEGSKEWMREMLKVARNAIDQEEYSASLLCGSGDSVDGGFDINATPLLKGLCDDIANDEKLWNFTKESS